MSVCPITCPCTTCKEGDCGCVGAPCPLVDAKFASAAAEADAHIFCIRSSKNSKRDAAFDPNDHEHILVQGTDVVAAAAVLIEVPHA